MNWFGFSLPDALSGLWVPMIYGVWFGMLVSLVRFFVFSGLREP